MSNKLTTGHENNDQRQEPNSDKPQEAKGQQTTDGGHSKTATGTTNMPSKPIVSISTNSGLDNSRFKLCSWNKSHHNKQLSNTTHQYQQENSNQDDPNAVAINNCEISTNFFNHLRRSHVNYHLGNCSQHNHHQNHNHASKCDRNNNKFSGTSTSRDKSLSDLSQIKGPTGSVRGHKNVVRKSLEGIRVASSRRNGLLSTFMSSPNCHTNSNLHSLSSSAASLILGTNYTNQNNGSLSMSKLSSLQQIDEQLCSEYLDRLVEDEQDHCVAYTTTLGIIRRTFDDSKLMKTILNLNLIKYEERDIYLNQEYKYQLKMRCNSIVVPALFVDGQHIGGAKELETMNETGELQKILSKFKMSAPAKDVCICCGNAKFIACPSCNGSRKSTIHHFKYNSIALRCIKCDKNDGLVQCPACFSSSSSCLGNRMNSATSSNHRTADESSSDDKLAKNDEPQHQQQTVNSTGAGGRQTVCIDDNNNSIVVRQDAKQILINQLDDNNNNVSSSSSLNNHKLILRPIDDNIIISANRDNRRPNNEMDATTNKQHSHEVSTC